MAKGRVGAGRGRVGAGWQVNKQIKAWGNTLHLILFFCRAGKRIFVVLKPLGPSQYSIVLRGLMGALNWAPTIPRDASLSDSCTSNRCCFFSFFCCCCFFLKRRNTFDLILSFVALNTEKSFRNIIKSNRNQIVFTMHRLIWNSKRTLSVWFQIIRKMVNTI